MFSNFRAKTARNIKKNIGSYYAYLYLSIHISIASISHIYLYLFLSIYSGGGRGLTDLPSDLHLFLIRWYATECRFLLMLNDRQFINAGIYSASNYYSTCTVHNSTREKINGNASFRWTRILENKETRNKNKKTEWVFKIHRYVGPFFQPELFLKWIKNSSSEMFTKRR